MPATARDVIAYICSRYPAGGDLSKARLTKIVYLADWRSAIIRNMTLTGIDWTFNNHGPGFGDIIETAREDSAFTVTMTENTFGSPKEVIGVRPDVTFPSLSTDDRHILDFVINTVSRLTWREFMELVYSTYPMVSQGRDSKLDLPRLAGEYTTGHGRVLT